MRRRLSSSFTLWQKISTSIFFLGFLLLTGISGKILNYLPESPILTWLVIALLAAGCFALVQFLLKDRTIVAFDDANLYIFRVKDPQEQTIPFRKLIGIALRPPSIEMGACWFWTYSLTFTGDGGEQERVRFWMLVGKTSYREFLSLVEAENPEFKVKNWTFY